MYANTLNNDKAAGYAEQPSQLSEPRLNQIKMMYQISKYLYLFRFYQMKIGSDE
jgi:hypothetical protein